MEFCSGNKIFNKNQYNIEQTIKDFNEIDFSLILKRSFHVTLDQNKKLLKKGNFDLFKTKNKSEKSIISKKKYKSQKNNMSPQLAILQSVETKNTEINQNKSTEDLSLIAGKIVTNALHIPRSLFCPFCADEYMFEFTLKDHLKRKHTKELSKRHENDLPESDQTLDDENNHYLCPYCNAVFYIFGLVPKHVANHHGRNWLQHWQQTYGKKLHKNNFSESPPETKDPSIIYAECSPGLSDIFDKLITKDSDSLLSNSMNNSPQLKSILKKTPSKHQPNRIINSPSGISIRRNKSEILKRSISVRRELRFDLPPLKITPNNSPVIRKHRKLQDLWQLFRCRKNKNSFSDSPLNTSKDFEKRRKGQKKLNSSQQQQQNIITSTPINFLDEINDTSYNYNNVKWNSKKLFGKRFTRKKAILKNLPLLFSSERYQCACCDERYQSNPDLLMHLKEKHRSAKYLLRPHYKCGQCGVKFFRNSYLVRHCHFQHTPQKNSNNRYNNLRFK